MSRSRLLPLALLAALAAIAILVAGCGSGGSSSSSEGSEPAGSSSESSEPSGESDSSEGEEEAGGGELAEVEKSITALEERPTSIGLETPLEKAAPKSKSVAFLGCGVPACQVLEPYFEEVTKRLGWKAKIIDLGLTPESVKAGWEEVVRLKPEGVVVTGSFPLSYYKPQLEQFHADGGVMINYAGTTEVDKSLGIIEVVHGISYFEKQGEIMAEWMVAKGDPKSTMFVNSPGFEILVPEQEAFESRLGELCSDCNFEVFEVPLTSVGKDLGSRVASNLQAHPGVTGIALAFADMGIGLAPALKGAGIETVPVVSQPQDSGVDELLRKGEISAVYASANAESMWKSADILIRHWNGESLKPDQETDQLPQWFLTQENVPDEDEYPLVEDYQKQFEALWGLTE